MPGTFTFKPIEANLTHNTDLLGRMNPYCSFILGNNRVKGQICKKGGKHPHWNDAVTLTATNESQVLVELMDKDKITHDDVIGSLMLDLSEVEASGQLSRWYPLTYKNKPAGEILIETVYQPYGANQGMLSSQTYQGEQYGMSQQSALYKEQQLGFNQGEVYREEHILTGQPVIVEETVTTTTTTSQPVIKEEIIVEKNSCIFEGGFCTDLACTLHQHAQQSSCVFEGGFCTDLACTLHKHAHGHIFTEQRQVVEPHTFMKEVEVVETRPALQEIEVMEPIKVVKDVQFTQPVPVKKQIEVVEPQVVRKEIEVIEPRVVTKTIQVVENVPVMRQVEVIELRNRVQEVDTIEPQTFTKQVEVTEYVPVRKQVEVTQPVTLRKAVEFVEPIITTQTITKELQQPVIVNEEITTTVGPASVVGISCESREYRELGCIGQTTTFRTEQERLLEEERLRNLNYSNYQTTSNSYQTTSNSQYYSSEQQRIDLENKLKRKL